MLQWRVDYFVKMAQYRNSTQTSMDNETPANERTERKTQTSDNGFIVDEEIKSLLPPLSAEDFAKLEKSILAEGCRDNLIVWTEENILADGHHRFSICDKHNIPYTAEYKSFANRDAVVLWMFENQKSRRNMNKFLWAEAVLKRKDAIATEAKANQRAGGGVVRLQTDKPVNTLKTLAKLAGVGRDTMHKVEFILTTAAINPTNAKLTEQVNKLRKGGVGVSIRSVYEELQELIGKRATGKKRASTPRSTRKPAHHPIPAPKSNGTTPEPSNDIEGHILATLEELEQQYPQTHDRIDLYNMVGDVVNDWAHKKKIELALSQKKIS